MMPALASMTLQIVAGIGPPGLVSIWKLWNKVKNGCGLTCWVLVLGGFGEGGGSDNTRYADTSSL